MGDAGKAGSRSLRTRDDSLWLEIRADEWLQITPDVIASLAARHCGVPRAAVTRDAGPVRRITGGPPDPVCERCGTRFPRPPSATRRNPKWCPGCRSQPKPARSPKTPPPSCAARTDTCPVCGREVSVTQADRLRLHRACPAWKNSCPGSGTTTGPPGGEPYTAGEFLGDCRDRGVPAGAAVTVLLAVAAEAMQSLPGGTR